MTNLTQFRCLMLPACLLYSTLINTIVQTSGKTENSQLYALSLDAGHLFQVGVSGALPVTIRSFTAEAQTGYNELRWQTTQEINLREFTVEYSEDGITWAKAGTLPPQTNKANPEYFFKHPTNVEGTMFYRLKLIDKDETFVYSKSISINTHPEKGKELQLFPTVNANGQLQIQLNKPFVNLKIYNMQGQPLITRNLQNQTGVIRLDIGGLKKGVYTVIVSRADKTVSKNFMVQ